MSIKVLRIFVNPTTEQIKNQSISWNQVKYHKVFLDELFKMLEQVKLFFKTRSNRIKYLFTNTDTSKPLIDHYVAYNAAELLLMVLSSLYPLIPYHSLIIIIISYYTIQIYNGLNCVQFTARCFISIYLSILLQLPIYTNCLIVCQTCLCLFTFIIRIKLVTD